ncbi:MAG: phosphomannomutase [Alteromonadaceae bacterium]|nr:phosphomannomutase [Alteromonadaceae bacterium]MBH84948.1 phosphomannomutase [Alteromonadaceae bacterium]|tara:strand:- start:4200 stop:6872 length:2673 start_codon:yes stop_codon:yes gene_type:complete
MKLGKKKESDAPAEKSGKATKEKAAAQQGAKKDAKGLKLKGLGSIALQQSAVVLLCGLVAAALLYVLVLQPAQNAQQAERTEQVVAAAKSRLEQRLALVKDVVTGYSLQVSVREAIDEPTQRRALVDEMQQMLPGTKAVFVFPYGEINRQSGRQFELSFVNLDLAKRAETGRQLHPDAFPRDGKWYVQYATPVADPNSRAIKGTLLVIFEASALAPALQVSDTALGGRLALNQTVSGPTQTVIAAGAGSGEQKSLDLSAPNWSIAYNPANTLSPVVDPVMALLIVVVPAVIAMLLVWVLVNRAQSGVRRDVAAMIQWAHKAFVGERVKAPAYQWELAASVGEALQRLAQVTEKRLAKAEEAAKASANASGKASAGKGGRQSAVDEPLFQETDALDIDMLDGDEDVLGFGEPVGGGDDIFGAEGFDVEETLLPSVEVAPSIFRAYDIRGVVGETLTGEIVGLIGQAIGSEALERQVTDLCIGYDGRHSSPELADALARGIMSTGCNVINVGAVPTPVLYFATHQLNTGSGVMVTGSHNPANYNGLKMMLAGDTLSGDQIQHLLQRIQAQDFAEGQGQYSEQDVRRPYLDRIIEDIAVAAPLKVVMDAGNGIAGELGPILVEELGCEVIPLFCEVDGDFPNHHPDPGKPENLEALIAKVKAEKADIGLAFDGDGDRLGVVTNTGKIIWPDRLLMLFARDVVSRNPGADVIYDVKCSRRLAGVINEAGGRPIMWKTGHSLMKAKMRETGALLAGEMSGHVFFKERWYGFDDGLYSAARLLEILGVEDRDSDDVFAELPDDISTPELNVAVTDENKFAIIEKLSAEGDFGDGNLSSIDGVRVDYPDGWGLCRASNTTPVLVLRFESETDAGLERIREIFRAQLAKVAPDVTITF